MITLVALNPREHELSDVQLINLVNLCTAMQEVEKECGKELIITSGYRTPEEQRKINPKASKSSHIECLACDIADMDKSLWQWCCNNLDFLAELGLYLEDGSATKTHQHFQLKAPASGKRVFLP